MRRQQAAGNLISVLGGCILNRYIDVWPIVPHSGASRYTYELLLQLATIVSNVHKIEKYTRMRIVSVVATADEIAYEYKRLVVDRWWPTPYFSRACGVQWSFLRPGRVHMPDLDV